MASSVAPDTIIDSPRPETSKKIDFGRMNRKAWLVTALLVLFQIVAFADKAVLGLVASEAIPDLGISAVEFGFIGSAFFFLYAVVSVVTGFLAARFSVRWIILTMGVVWAVMQFPMLLGGGAAILLVTRIVLGGAEGPATAMSLTSVHSWFEPRRRALPSNLVAAGSTLGPVLAAPALAWVIGEWGWRWAFGALGIVGFVWVVAWVLLAGDGPHSGHGKLGEGEDGVSAEATAEMDTEDVDKQKPIALWRAFASLTFLAAVIGGGSNFWVQGFVTTWLPQYLGTVVGLSLPQVGTVTTIPWILGAIVLLFLGYLGHRLMQKGFDSHRSIAVPFGIAALVAGICFILVQTASGVFAVALLCIAAGCSLAYPMTASALAFSVGKKQRPIMMATLGGVASVGAIISPTLVGWLMTRAGYVSPPSGSELTPEMANNMAAGVHQAFTITGVVLLVGGVLCILFLRPEALGRKLQAGYSK
ncbi:MFS transporter [Rhodococcus sp. F64268]|uniref:MFS transporter n=1 Tax=Rhodococcus sp. F64268 TaxID=2926402 RepID=UPI001FF4B21D|nr:MFS transporter [Rhodococcus sp. F64268]MCK0090560.1 MFS transporter [Rhodococcus sp. F64268]